MTPIGLYNRVVKPTAGLLQAAVGEKNAALCTYQKFIFEVTKGKTMEWFLEVPFVTSSKTFQKVHEVAFFPTFFSHEAVPPDPQKVYLINM